MVVRRTQNALPEPIPGPRIFVGKIVHSKTRTEIEILPNGAIGVESDGTIAFVECWEQGASDDLVSHYAPKGFQNAKLVRLKRSQFLFPGMVDTHLHAPQWPNLALGMEGTLRDWVENWTDPVEASYFDNEKARRVYADVTETTLKLGSTTVAYNSSIHVEATKILADAALKAGQRAIIGKMSITHGATHDNCDKSTKQSLQAAEEVIQYIQGRDAGRKLVHACTQPRGGPYCPPELMKGLGELTQKYNVHVQGHMCETQDDINRTLNLHPQVETYSDMYHAYGLLTERSILAHCIHLSPRDVVLLKQYRAGIAHNPNSNTCLRDGECRVRDLFNQGIKVGLGTDCSAGYMPSIQDAMRNASNVSRHLALHLKDDLYVLRFEELVWLATMGGAEVIHMQDMIGNFAAGKKFDALMVDAEGVVSADRTLWEDGSGSELTMVKKWVFLGDDRNICRVYVDGRLVAGSEYH